jgi:dTDP-4-amino-4,6-dideoxygalactose transaminase
MAQDKSIPFVDLKAQYQTIETEINDAVRSILREGIYVGGDIVKKFEAEFSSYCGVRGCVGVGNGTDALYLALRALGIGPGDEVITVTHTFIATSEAITLTGARPVFVDINPRTRLMDPNAFMRAITTRTKAVIPVHLEGRICDMDSIIEIARPQGVKVIEDASQAHGAVLHGRRAGSLGDLGCFSFYPGKNLGAYGDAGAVVGNDTDVLGRVRKLANHGRQEKYVHECEGVNSRLDSLQAAILRVKLSHLEEWNAKRRRLASLYGEWLPTEVQGPTKDISENQSAWHLLVIESTRREELRAYLAKNGIESGVHYPIPLHLQPAYRYLNYRPGSFPFAEDISTKIVSLPLYPEMGDERVRKVCSTIRKFFLGG